MNQSLTAALASLHSSDISVILSNMAGFGIKDILERQFENGETAYSQKAAAGPAADKKRRR